MKKLLGTTTFLFIILLSSNVLAGQKACFSPKQESLEFCEDLIVKELEKATNSIKISIYNFTNKRIESALIKSIEKGVDVVILYDRNQPKGSVIGNIKGAKLISHKGFRIHHHKFVIIDDKIVINGSYNWTTNASLNNTEDGVLTDDKEVIKDFNKKFNSLLIKYNN